MKKAFAPIVFPDSKILILGTMPGEKSLELQEYYGNRGNQFWRLLFEIFKKPIVHDYKEKVQLLNEHRIALWDVLAYCEREGSLDSNIKNEVPNDFEKFHKDHPGIRHIFFSSKNASTYFDKYVGRREDMSYTILPSPSGANATKPYSVKLGEWTEKILPHISL